MKKLILFAILSVLMISVTGIFAQTTAKPKLNVAILIFDGVQIIDYTGPYEVLGSRRRRNVYTVAEKPDPITTNMGMQVMPNYSFANQPRPDIIIIPGGGNITPGADGRGVGAQLNNQKVIDWIKENAKDSKYVMSVCNGAFLLAKAGLLENLQATTTAGFIPSLKKFSPTTGLVYDKRFVDNGKIITTAGLTSGMDGALHLIEKLDGKGWAKFIALGIEYNWQPESSYARASLADTRLPNSLGDAIPNNAEPLDFNGDKTRWEEKWIVETSQSPADLNTIIDKLWATEPRWKKTPDNTWKLTDNEGKTWSGWAGAERDSKSSGRLILTFGVELEQKRTAAR